MLDPIEGNREKIEKHEKKNQQINIIKDILYVGLLLSGGSESV
jgi:hypothetical protein